MVDGSISRWWNRYILNVYILNRSLKNRIRGLAGLADNRGQIREVSLYYITKLKAVLPCILCMFFFTVYDFCTVYVLLYRVP